MASVSALYIGIGNGNCGGVTGVRGAGACWVDRCWAAHLYCCQSDVAVVRCSEASIDWHRKQAQVTHALP